MEESNGRGVLTWKRIRKAWWTERHKSKISGIRNTDELDGPIYVFSPSGEVYQLKRDSTVVDFAFKVHSELGPYAKRFYINGKQCGFKEVLHHRDLVEIEYDQSIASVEPQWEEEAKTDTAKIAIRRFLRGNLSPVHRGRAILDKIIERESEVYNMRFEAEDIEKWIEDAAYDDFYLSHKDELYTKIADGTIAPDVIVANFYERELSLFVRKPQEIEERYTPDIRFARSWMQAPKGEKFNRSQRITPGTDIIGRLMVKGEDAEIVVHRADSIHAPSLDEPMAVELWWSSGSSKREAIQVTVRGSTKPMVTAMVMRYIHNTADETPNADIMLSSFKSEIRDHMTFIEFTLDTANKNYIANLDRNLNALRDIHTIAAFKIWEVFPGQRKLLASLSDRRQRNPYTTHHVRDSAMFFGRRNETNRIVDAIKDGMTFIIIHGDKRIGKTSLMYHLAEQEIPSHDELDVIPVLFDTLKAAPVTELSFAQGLMQEAMSKINRRIKRQQRQKLQKIAQTVHNDPLDTLVHWVRTAERYLKGTRIYFMVDEFTAVEDSYRRGDIQHGFFQRMHHIVDHGEVAFLLCIHNHVLRNLTHRLGDMNLRGLTIPIDTLEHRAARLLVRAPLERFYTYEEGVEDAILNLTDCHPYYIQLLCGAIYTRMAVIEETHITFKHLEKAKSEMMQSAFHSFSHYFPQQKADAPRMADRKTLEVIAFL